MSFTKCPAFKIVINQKFEDLPVERFKKKNDQEKFDGLGNKVQLKQKKIVNTEIMLHEIIFVYALMRKVQFQY